MQQFPFENSDIVLYEDGPFAEYLRNTSQRLDNVRYEGYESVLNELNNIQDSQKSEIEYENDAEMRQEIDNIQTAIKQKENRKCLLLLYTVIPCFIQPITKHQSIINDVISDFVYNVDSNMIHQIYASLYSYFHDPDNDDVQNDPDQTLFTTTLIISNRYILFLMFIFHSIFLILLFYVLNIPILLNIILIGIEIMNIIFIIIDIIEYYQWIFFFNGIYEMIHYLSQFQSFVDKSFKVLNNVTAITNGYSLHHQFIASHKIEHKNLNITQIHLNNLRLQLKHHFVEINDFLYKITSFIANKPKLVKDIENNKDKLMLKDLLLLYKHFRIHQKILFTQLYRISSPLIHCNKFCKSIRGIWFKGITFRFMQKDNDQIDPFMHYLQSPFSCYQLHVDLSIIKLFKYLQQSLYLLYRHNISTKEQTKSYSMLNKFNSLNNLLSELTVKFRAANIALFGELKLSKKPKFNRFSTSKIINAKQENLSKIAKDINNDNENEKQKLNEIYNHLHRLQNRMDEMTSQIYLMHEQCIQNPSNIIVKGKIESKYNGDDQDEDDADLDDEIEQYKSLEIMRDIMLGLNRTFNEWKFIVSNINPNSKLLEKYKNIGFGNQGLLSSNKYRYHQEMETVVIEDNNYIDQDDEKLISFKTEQKSIMSGLFSKLNKQRAKMSITEDGEELYEPTEETKRALKAKLKQQQSNNNESKDNTDEILNASMSKPGSAISLMDKYNMVDELKNVLKTRKQAAIKKFQQQKRTQIESSTNDIDTELNKDEIEEEEEEEEMKYNIMNREEAMANIRGSYPREEVIENYYSDQSSDDQDNEQDTITQQQEQRFMMELNRLGLRNAFVTTTNTQISSFGYDRQKDKNTMSLFAVLQNQNKREMKSVLNGDADDVEIEFKLNDNDNNDGHHGLNEIEEDDDENQDNDMTEYQSELQKSFQDARSDDEGGTLADELSGIMQ